MYVQKTSGGAAAASRPVSKGMQEFSRDFPALHEYLTLTAYPDGSERKTSTMLLFVEDGSVKLCLSDRDNESTLWATDDSLEEAMLSLEAVLASGTGSWRASRQRQAAKRK